MGQDDGIQLAPQTLDLGDLAGLVGAVVVGRAGRRLYVLDHGRSLTNV